MTTHRDRERSVERVALGLGYAASLVIVAATFTRSFAAMADFAVRVGAARPGVDAWLVPLGIDVAIVAASVMAWASARAGRRNRWAYGLFIFAALTSVALNVAHAPIPPNHPDAVPIPAAAAGAGVGSVWWARFIAALPPVLLLWITEVLLRHVTPHPTAHVAVVERDAAQGPAPEHADRATDRAWDADGSARDRVLAVVAAHTAGGGDPAKLTGPQVAQSAGCSVRRAQEVLAELRTPALVETSGNGHAHHAEVGP